MSVEMPQLLERKQPSLSSRTVRKTAFSIEGEPGMIAEYE